ncbi:MAG: hypothetical protein KDJ16_05265 [Hyphomicrobiales bacterium]|nr:hypothetical protein [Hyphomicrobiales bacterium]
MWQQYLHPFFDSLNGPIMIGIFICGIIGGWISNSVLGESGFGLIIGTVLVIFGIVIGLVGLSIAGMRIDDNFAYTTSASVGGAAVVILATALLRKL